MDTRMKLLPFLFFWCCVLSGCATRQSCTQENYDVCAKSLLSEVANTSSIFIQFTVPEMRHICQVYRTARTCIEQFEHSCNDKTKASLQSLHDHYEYICHENLNAFAVHRDCLASVRVHERGLLCNASFTVNIVTPGTGSRCGHYRAYVDCIAEEVTLLCGQEAGQWEKGLKEKTLKPILNYYKCRLDMPSESYCTKKNVKRCFEPLKGHFEGRADTNVVPTFSINKMKAICQIYTTVRPCLDTLIDNCHPANIVSLRSVHDSYQYVCDDHFKDFVAHRDCLVTPNLVVEGQTCINAFHAALNSTSFQEGEPNYKRKRLCQYTKTFMDCAENLVSSFCGQQASLWVRGLAEATHGPLLKQIKCTEYSRFQKSTKHYTIFLFWIMPAGLVLVLLCVLVPIGVYLCNRKKKNRTQTAPPPAGGDGLPPTQPAGRQAGQQGPVPQTVMYNVGADSAVRDAASAGSEGAFGLVPPPYSEKPNLDELAGYEQLEFDVKMAEAGMTSPHPPPAYDESTHGAYGPEVAHSPAETDKRGFGYRMM